jgi:hypothetical protein
MGKSGIRSTLGVALLLLLSGPRILRAQEAKPTPAPVAAQVPAPQKPVVQPVDSLTTTPQIVNGDLEWSNYRIPVKQGPVMPGEAAAVEKLNAALPSLLRPKFTLPAASPQTGAVRNATFGFNLQGINAALQAYKQRAASILQPATSAAVPSSGTSTLKVNPGLHELPTTTTKLPQPTSSAGTSLSGTSTLKVSPSSYVQSAAVIAQPTGIGPGGLNNLCLFCVVWSNTPCTPGGLVLNAAEAAASEPLLATCFSTLNENRAAMISAVLAANAPASWQSPTALPATTFNPNNVLAGLLAGDTSAWTFAGQFMAYNNGQGLPCPESLAGAEPSGEPYVQDATSPFPPPQTQQQSQTQQDAYPASPICPAVIQTLATGQTAPAGAYLLASSPNISITVPTHTEFWGPAGTTPQPGWVESNGTYSLEAFLATQIAVQILQTDANGDPIPDPSDPLGLKFANYPGVAPVTPVQNPQSQFTNGSSGCGPNTSVTYMSCPPGESFDPNNPIATWIVDSTADFEIGRQLQSSALFTGETTQGQTPTTQTWQGLCAQVLAAWQEWQQANANESWPQSVPEQSDIETPFSLSPGGFQVTWGETFNCGVPVGNPLGAGAPPIVYLDYEAGTSTLPDDTTTFNLHLTGQLTVVRFLLESNGSEYSSVLIPIVVQPTAAVTVTSQPLALVYMPPGNQSSAKYATSSGQGVTIVTNFQLQSSTTQANGSSQSLQFGGNVPLGQMLLAAAGGGGSGGGSGAGGGGSGGGSINGNASYQETSGQTTTTGQGTNSSGTISSMFSTSYTDTLQVGPTSGLYFPGVVPWQANSQYCDDAQIPSIVSPTPPDGNAYMCIPDPSNANSNSPVVACTSGPNQPSFNPAGAVSDGAASGPEGCWWMSVGSAAVFQSPFWNDLFAVAIDPQIYLWDYAGTSSGEIQALPATGNEGALQVSALTLHLCAQGLLAVSPLTAYDCASLLSLDPFYMNGQHASQPSWAALAQGETKVLAGSPTLSYVSTEGVTAGLGTGTSSSSQIQTVSGNTLSLGIQPLISGTSGSSQTNSSGVQFSMLTTPTTSQNVSQNITATLQSSDSSIEVASVWVDGRFQTVMFPGATPSASIDPTGGPGCQVNIQGSGLTGTTSINFGTPPAMFPAVYSISSDSLIEVYVPSLLVKPGPVTVSIQVEGVPGSISVGTFQVGPTPCTST